MSDILDDFNDHQTEMKSRHGCVSAWLWLGLIGSAITILIYLFAGDMLNQGRDLQDQAPVSFMIMIVLAIASAAGLVGYYMIMQWKKVGFYIVAGISVLSGIISYMTIGDITSLVGVVLGPLLLYGILQIRKDDIAAWDHLE